MRRGLALAVVVLTLGTAAARAAAFSLSFASAADQSALGGDGEPGFSGSATLIGTELSPGQYNITSSIGTTIVDPNFAAQGYAYIPNPSPPSVSVSPDGFLTYDGAVFDGTPRLSGDGLLWVGVANGADEDIFSFEGNYFILDVWGQADPDGPFFAASVIDLSITEVPEPATWTLMAFGFTGLGFAAHRARKAVPIAP